MLTTLKHVRVHVDTCRYGVSSYKNDVSAKIVAIHTYRGTSKHVIEFQHVTIHGAQVACHQRYVDIASAPDVRI